MGRGFARRIRVFASQIRTGFRRAPQPHEAAGEDFVELAVPMSPACRRPRPLATNAPRLFNARALRRVRFSAVSISNKKAGRCVYLPACNYWWRRGESNSGPRKPPDWHLQAQSLVLSRTLCAQRHARGVLTGSVLARAIPITCAGAFP